MSNALGADSGDRQSNATTRMVSITAWPRIASNNRREMMLSKLPKVGCDFCRKLIEANNFIESRYRCYHIYVDGYGERVVCRECLEKLLKKGYEDERLEARDLHRHSE